eukprot:1949507-Pyramimonas_sp.AAC.1
MHSAKFAISETNNSSALPLTASRHITRHSVALASSARDVRNSLGVGPPPNGAVASRGSLLGPW